MCNVRIGYETGDHLSIEVMGRTYPNATCNEDMNWLNSNISISAGAFNGTVSALLRSPEFDIFLRHLEELAKSLKGSAKYVSVEQWLEIKICGNGLGHLTAEGFVADDVGRGNRLNFVIVFDQTVITDMINGVRHIIEKYPIAKL